MDHVSAGEAQREVARHRRRRMRAQATSHRASPVPGRFLTPAWLERSFVLPLMTPEATDERADIPAQRRVAGPVEPPEESSVAEFARPSHQDIDFARVVRRADLCRMVTRLHWIATGLAGVALVLFLLLSSVLLLGLVLVLALVAVAAFAARVSLNRAPVPRVRR